MFTPTQIEIIKLLGSKELSFGCLVMLSNPKTWKILDTFPYTIISHSEWYYTDFIPRCTRNSENIKSCEILWHLPTLDDLFIKAEEKEIIVRIWSNESTIYWFIGINETTFRIPYNPKLKPYQQTEETMENLIALLK